MKIYVAVCCVTYDTRGATGWVRDIKVFHSMEDAKKLILEEIEDLKKRNEYLICKSFMEMVCIIVVTLPLKDMTMLLNRHSTCGELRSLKLRRNKDEKDYKIPWQGQENRKVCIW